MAQRKRRNPPAMTPEDRENQLISEATALAEQKILDGTASTQLIVHYLKLGSEKARLENEKLKKENELLQAKTEDLQSRKRSEELYERALEAMRRYNGTEYEVTDD